MNQTFERGMCSCGGETVRQMSSSTTSTVMEMKDRYHGKQLRKNQDRVMKKRLVEHHDRYELEDKIDEFGLEEAVRGGWTKKGKAKKV